MANRDYGRYLPQALDSLVAQTYPCLEVIVVDDGSTDGSPGVFRTWRVHRRPDVPVLYHRLPHNCGYAWAMNVGIALAKGEFVAFQDADDLSRPPRLERQVTWFREHPDGGLVGTDFVAFEDGRPLQRTVPRWLRHGEDVVRCYRAGGHCVSLGTAMVRGTVLDQLGPFNRRCPGAEDYELVARVVAAGWRVDNLPEVLYLNRIHPGKRSSLYYGKAARASDQAHEGDP